MFSWNSLAFLMIQWILSIWSLVPLPFLNPAWTSVSSRFTYLKPDLEDFEHYFTRMWDECNCLVAWAFFGIAFLWDWNENWPFPDEREYFQWPKNPLCSTYSSIPPPQKQTNSSHWSFYCLHGFALAYKLRQMYFYQQCNVIHLHASLLSAP